MTHEIQIAATDGSGSFKAYVALPSAKKGPAIIALQEVFGVNAGMREICNWLAGLGYVGICPDLFWRQETGVELSDKTQAEMDKALGLYAAFDYAKGMEDITATIEAARSFEASTGKVGTLGYCLGGLLAYYAATRTDADANASYYGVGVDQRLDEAAAISTPLLMHVACEDVFVGATQQAEIHKVLDSSTLVTVYDYPGTNHAFARPGGIDWNAEAAALANSRTAKFFEMHLKNRG